MNHINHNQTPNANAKYSFFLFFYFSVLAIANRIWFEKSKKQWKKRKCPTLKVFAFFAYICIHTQFILFDILEHLLLLLPSTHQLIHCQNHHTNTFTIISRQTFKMPILYNTIIAMENSHYAYTFTLFRKTFLFEKFK